MQRDGRWALEPDPEQVPLIEEIVEAVLGGESAMSVADLYGVDHTNLLRRLRRPSLYGLVIFKGEVVRGPDGMPVTREPIIDRATWNRLQARLDKNSIGKGTPRDAFTVASRPPLRPLRAPPPPTAVPRPAEPVLQPQEVAEGLPDG